MFTYIQLKPTGYEIIATLHIHCQVSGWASSQFGSLVSREKPDHQINIAKACLLLALEEEAEFEVHPEMEATVRRARNSGKADTNRCSIHQNLVEVSLSRQPIKRRTDPWMSVFRNPDVSSVKHDEQHCRETAHVCGDLRWCSVTASRGPSPVCKHRASHSGHTCWEPGYRDSQE